MIFERKSPTDSVSIIDMHINKQLPTNNQVFPSHAKCSQAYDFNLLTFLHFRTTVKSLFL